MTKPKLNFPSMRAHGFTTMGDVVLVPSYWLSNGSLMVPAPSYPVANNVQPVAKVSVPRGRAKCFTVNGYMVGGASVVGLFSHSRPSTVVWGVVAIIVDALNGVLRGWLFSHVGQKVGRTLITKPPTANLDSAPAVSVVHGVFGVVAPVQHSPVAAVNAAVSNAVLDLRRRLQLVCHAAARLCIAIASQMARDFNLFSAAVGNTAKKPYGLILFCLSSELNGFEKAVNLAGDVKSRLVGHGRSWLMRKDYMFYRTRNQQATIAVAPNPVGNPNRAAVAG